MRTNTKFNLRAASVLTLCLLSACASKTTKNGATRTPDNEPTLKSLAGRTVLVEKDKGVVTSEAQAIKAYRSFLDTAPKAAKISNAPLRAEAMRRIGDLEMDSADVKSESPQVENALGGGQDNGPDYRTAVARYQEFLKTYPSDPNNDRVLYQLARAQEQNGDLESAFKTLDRLVKGYPDTVYRDEAQFRRGELLFTTRDYVMAEQAYATVLRFGAAGRYHDRALYMRGWSQFKQGKLDDALLSFFAVLDIKLLDKEGDAGLESIADLSRAERELVEDTFRVTSICLANLQGADSIAAYINSPIRETYEFRVYQQLGELYLRQERVKDAADTFSLFARRKPLDAQAPILQARVIAIYEGNGFATLALEAKKEYVVRYGSKSEFRRANPDGWMKAQTLVKTHVAELAQHYHASAQKSKNTADYQEAVHWYREYLDSFPSDPQAAQNNFLLAELLFEDGHFAEASVEYEKTAYAYPPHAKSADAGYAALLSYAKQLADPTQLPTQLPALQKASVASAIRFAQTFSADPRAAAVLANAAEKLYALKDNEQAATLAQRLLDLQPAAADQQRRVAWTILAYTAFERAAYAPAELAFAEVLRLTAASAAGRNELIERLAASIYKQGEQARNAGQLSEAVRHFERIASIALAPSSPVRATAQYDAAATLMSLKDWPSAARTLEDFRSRYPNNPLQSEVGNKLAVVYLENAQWENAAKELERLAAGNNTKDAKSVSDMLWQAAELYEKSGSRAAAKKTYERYLTLASLNLESAIEARFRLAGIAKEEGNAAKEFALMKEIFQADHNGGTARTERTRYLAATAALAIAEPVAEAYRKIALIEPLQKNLKLKKAKMEEVLKAYAVATDFGVADVSTAAIFRIASIYHDFGKALMASERPKKLSKIEREQYNVLLEEQAFPFEEKAIEVHSINAQRSATGIYDKWVKNSFAALRELQPVRYGKTERTEAFVDAAPLAIKQAAAQNQLGIKLRQDGKFDQAREAYELAIKLDANYATAILNLGILYDMYLADGMRAQDLYTRYLTITQAGDSEVSKWLTELKNRKPNSAVAQKEKS